MLTYIKALFSSILDSFRENFGYHSASLTYQFLMVMGSIILLLAFISLYLPFFDPWRVYEYTKNALPSYATSLLDKMVTVYEKRASGSLLSLALAYYFSLSFTKSLNLAFGFVSQRKPIEREVFIWIALPFLLILYGVVLSLAIVLLTLSKNFLGFLGNMFVDLFNLLLLFLVISMLYSSYFKPKRKTLIASAFTSLLLFLLNKLFSLVLVKMISLNPLYTIIGSPLLLLVWLYYSFYLLLIGARLIAKLSP